MVFKEIVCFLCVIIFKGTRNVRQKRMRRNANAIDNFTAVRQGWATIE